MGEMGYYNYYNNSYRWDVDKPHDRYQEMVDRYQSNSDTLHSNNEDPYSEKNLKIRNFEVQLSNWAEGVRSQCSTESDVYSYVAQKYFGKSSITYIDVEKLDTKTRAMYNNDLNAVLYGTYQNSNTNDPRIGWSQEDWETESQNIKTTNQKIISTQMSNLLSKSGITLENNTTMLISFNPYTYSANIEGVQNSETLKQLTELLNSGDNAKELFKYTLQNSENIDQEALNKYRTYQTIKDLTGEDLSKLSLKDGNFYTENGTNIIDLVKSGIKENNTIPKDFKEVALESTQNMLNEVAKKGFNSTSDLKLSIGYSKEYGFFVTNNIINDA